MLTRTIRTGIGTYRDVDGRWTHGFLGDEVDVHDEDLERFDRLNPAEGDPSEEIESTSDDAAVEIPEGDPSEEWTNKQLEAYAAALSIDLGAAKNKADRLAAIAAASA